MSSSFFSPIHHGALMSVSVEKHRYAAELFATCNGRMDRLQSEVSVWAGLVGQGEEFFLFGCVCSSHSTPPSNS